MKNAKWLLLAGIAILLMTMGCQKQMGFTEPQEDVVGIAAASQLQHQYNPGGSWFTYFHYLPPALAVVPLSIGNDNGSNGDVHVWKGAIGDPDGETLYVEYHTRNGWYLYMTHVAVGCSTGDIPHNKSGEMQPGKFKYGGLVTPPAQVALVPVPWAAAWNDPPYFDSLFIVAHSIVFKVVAPGETIWQTGCGGEGEPHKQLKLPNYTIELLRVALPFVDSNTYWQIGLRGITGDYNVWDGDQWKGWCAERHKGLGYDWIPVTLVNSEDLTPASPPRLWKNGHWDNVNWLINHKDLFPAPPAGPYAWYLYQTCIHYILGELPDAENPQFPPTDYWVRTMYEAAMTQGEGFRVGGVLDHGWIAVLCVTPIDQQLVFIEVDP